MPIPLLANAAKKRALRIAERGLHPSRDCRSTCRRTNGMTWWPTRKSFPTGTAPSRDCRSTCRRTKADDLVPNTISFPTEAYADRGGCPVVGEFGPTPASLTTGHPRPPKTSPQNHGPIYSAIPHPTAQSTGARQSLSGRPPHTHASKTNHPPAQNPHPSKHSSADHALFSYGQAIRGISILMSSTM